jgi:hypothetical protein
MWRLEIHPRFGFCNLAVILILGVLRLEYAAATHDGMN